MKRSAILCLLTACSIFLLVPPGNPGHSQVTTKTITALTEDTAPTGASITMIVSGGNSRKASLTNLTKGLAPASATAQGVVTTGAQTIAGAKELSSTTTSFPSAWNDNLKLSASLFPAFWLHANSPNKGYLLGYQSNNGLSILRESIGTLSTTLNLDDNGLVGINKGSSIGSQLHIVTGSSSRVGQIIELASTPTANALEVNSSAGSGGNLVKIDNTGLVYSGAGFSPSANAKFYATGGYPSITDGQGVQVFTTGASVGQNVWFSKAVAWGTNYFTHDVAINRDSAGVLQVNSGTQDTLRDLKARSVILSSTPPANASDTGVTGTVTWDSDFIYVCTATNTWKRVAIATW